MAAWLIYIGGEQLSTGQKLRGPPQLSRPLSQIKAARCSFDECNRAFEIDFAGWADYCDG
jgi:hypothetical protein